MVFDKVREKSDKGMLNLAAIEADVDGWPASHRRIGPTSIDSATLVSFRSNIDILVSQIVCWLQSERKTFSHLAAARILKALQPLEDDARRELARLQAYTERWERDSD